MKTLTKTQIDPIKRDLLIATGAGFTMALLLFSAIVLVLG